MSISTLAKYKRYYELYNNGINGGLFSHYKKPSDRKLRAYYKHCERLHINNGVKQVRILTHNTSYFTLGSIGYNNGIKCFIITFPSREIFIPIEVLENEC